MKRKTILAISLIATTAIGGALALPVLAHGQQSGEWRSHEGAGSHGMLEGQGTMPGQGAMMGGQNKMGNHGTMQMHGQINGQINGGIAGSGMMGGAMFTNFDADGDGTVTPEEVLAGLKAQLEEFDTDGNGTLSIAEFEVLHSAGIREMMVDRFQMLDADGDGQVTSDEIAAPAERMEKMQKLRAEHMGGKASGQEVHGSGQGTMMNDN